LGFLNNLRLISALTSSRAMNFSIFAKFIARS
jgi:hypothetical protein